MTQREPSPTDTLEVAGPRRAQQQKSPHVDRLRSQRGDSPVDIVAGHPFVQPSQHSRLHRLDPQGHLELTMEQVAESAYPGRTQTRMVLDDHAIKRATQIGDAVAGPQEEYSWRRRSFRCCTA